MALCYEDNEESLLSTYRVVTSVLDFKGTKAFRRCCVQRERDFSDGSLDCNDYIIFTRVSLLDMMTVDRVRRSLPRMCCLYDNIEEVLIVKLKVGVGHATSSIGFLFIFTDKLRDLGLRDEIVITGSTTFGDGRRQKEADESFKPLGTRRAIDAWPNLTYEVGLSESLGELRNDAHFWLTRSELQTNIVLVIHIDRVRRLIEIERWEVINLQRPYRTNVQYSPIVGCVQCIVLREGDVYTGPPLELLVEFFFDRVPPNLAAGAFDFTAPELQAWNDSFWRVFR